MTISEQEAQQLAAPATPVAREAAQRVLDYLIFHRALIDEPGTPPAVLERYLELVRNLKEGVHVIIDDPVQKATALLFELVMDEAFDPWEIDLVRFTQAYLERVQAERRVDFAVAGRLVYMAWSILYLQSEEVLKHREEPVDATDPALLDGGLETPVDDGYLSELTTPEAVDVTTAVLDATESPLVEMVRHPETRPVSLLELVQAFGQAEEDARRALRLEELRERLREEQQAPPEVLVHGDIPERDLADTWEMAKAHAIGERFPFLSLWRAQFGRDRLVALFLAALFLAREQSIELHQETLGESPVELVRLREERPPRVEEVG
jgi:segregation and condensation protein A